MFDGVGDYLEYYNIGKDNTSEHVEADCNDIFSQAAKSINEIYNKGSKSFSIYGNGIPYIPNGGIAGFIHPLQMSALPQMMDITNKKVFIVLGIFEYDSIPHDMKLLIFAESEEKARGLIDEIYSTDTSFFMIKNIKEV